MKKRICMVLVVTMLFSLCIPFALAATCSCGGSMSGTGRTRTAEVEKSCHITGDDSMTDTYIYTDEVYECDECGKTRWVRIDTEIICHH